VREADEMGEAIDPGDDAPTGNDDRERDRHEDGHTERDRNNDGDSSRQDDGDPEQEGRQAD